jgi:signal peptidase I
MADEPDEQPARRKRRVVVGLVLSILVVGAVGFVVLRADHARYRIVSEGMLPTLDAGDRIEIEETHDVVRGDIIVFRLPAAAREQGIPTVVKRVIGEPGDRVELIEGYVYINGRLLREPYVGHSRGKTEPFGAEVPTGCEAPKSGWPGCVVPSKHVFVMGDNRQASKDSRVYGPIAMSLIVGRQA